MNGMAVSKAFHNGSHAGYNKMLGDKINKWADVNPDYSPEDAMKFISSLAGQARKAVDAGTKSGKKVTSITF